MDDATAFPTVKAVLETILTNQAMSSPDTFFYFGPNSLQFALDNCATHHICNNKSLFIRDMWCFIVSYADFIYKEIKICCTCD